MCTWGMCIASATTTCGAHRCTQTQHRKKNASIPVMMRISRDVHMGHAYWERHCHTWYTQRQGRHQTDTCTNASQTQDRHKTDTDTRQTRAQTHQRHIRDTSQTHAQRHERHETDTGQTKHRHNTDTCTCQQPCEFRTQGARCKPRHRSSR